MKKKNAIWIFFFNLLCAKLHLTDKNHSEIDVDVKPQKEALYTQVVHISIKTCDRTTAARASPKCDGVTMETQAKSEAGCTAVPFDSMQGADRVLVTISS